ncbi:hypothetical protein E2C01_051326 [Portunus trituberculatus]|uniref:Uncharacterized protein n=1 Tax=Portunus trituberculatus TaxID=210409 RepID=A0A5B7GJ98_PORTR|nr:hypothetical protein [Portunus trituberculatus]
MEGVEDPKFKGFTGDWRAGEEEKVDEESSPLQLHRSRAASLTSRAYKVKGEVKGGDQECTGERTYLSHLCYTCANCIS